MRERSLVAFTVLSQTAVGAVWALLASSWLPAPAASGAAGADAAPAWLHAAAAGLAAVGLAVSLLHLGRPRRAWRALAHLGTSWLSAEVCAAGLFLGTATLAAVLADRAPATGSMVAAAQVAAALLGAALLGAMARVYRLRTVPAWNAWTTPASFACTALVLGALGVAVAVALAAPPAAGPATPAQARTLASVALAAMVADGLVLGAWLRGLRAGGRAARAAWQRVAVRRRALLLARVVLSGLALLACASALAVAGRPVLLAGALALALAAQVLGRALFYLAGVREGV